MTESERKAARERLEAITSRRTFTYGEIATGAVIAGMMLDDVSVGWERENKESKRSLAFIAVAPDDLRKALDEVDRLRAIVEAVTGAVYVRHVDDDGAERWSAVAPHEQTGDEVLKALEGNVESDVAEESRRGAEAAYLEALSKIVNLSTLAGGRHGYDFQVEVRAADVHVVTQCIVDLEYDMHDSTGIHFRTYVIPV